MRAARCILITPQFYIYYRKATQAEVLGSNFGWISISAGAISAGFKDTKDLQCHDLVTWGRGGLLYKGTLFQKLERSVCTAAHRERVTLLVARSPVRVVPKLFDNLVRPLAESFAQVLPRRHRRLEMHTAPEATLATNLREFPHTFKSQRHRRATRGWLLSRHEVHLMAGRIELIPAGPKTISLSDGSPYMSDTNASVTS